MESNHSCISEKYAESMLTCFPIPTASIMNLIFLTCKIAIFSVYFPTSNARNMLDIVVFSIKKTYITSKENVFSLMSINYISLRKGDKYKKKTFSNNVPFNYFRTCSTISTKYVFCN